MEVLQTSALPLGYVAPPFVTRFYLRCRQPQGRTTTLGGELEEQEFRDVMARLAASVVVISARTDRGFRGLTATSFVSISTEPPMVLVGLERMTITFNVSVLTRSQEFIAERFAGRAPAVAGAWSDVPHHLGANGLPLIDGCAAWLECKLAQVHQAGDHDICVGGVEAATKGDGEPLILWDRSFWSLR